MEYTNLDNVEHFSKSYGTSEVDTLCEHLQNLDELVTGVRKVNKTLTRIRPTTNNPVSSRSILVYTFEVTCQGVVTYLQVVDMMGYEDFSKTPPKDDGKGLTHTGLQLNKYRQPVPKVVTYTKELLHEGHFIRYSLKLAAEHTKKSPTMNNALFNFPVTKNTTLKNIGIYIVNNTGANKTKIDLLFQSARFGEPAFGKTPMDYDSLEQTPYIMNRKSEVVNWNPKQGEGTKEYPIPFEVTPIVNNKKVETNSDRLLELIKPLGLNTVRGKREDDNKEISAVALLAAVKNRQIDRYFAMQKDQIDFLKSLRLPKTPIK
jgi:hypothetical protein